MKIQNFNSNPSRNKKRQAPRADFHDYKAPGYYHITITAYPGSPRLSEIPMPCKEMLRKRDMIIPKNTELGESVKNELLAISRKNPKLQIKRYVIMPDHIHFVLQVTSYLDKPIGKYIAPFTKSCSQAYTNLFNLSKFSTLFKPQGELFDLCAAGRLLLLAPWPDNLERRSTAGSTKFHKMNDLAAAIAALPVSARLSLHFESNS